MISERGTEETLEIRGQIGKKSNEKTVQVDLSIRVRQNISGLKWKRGGRN